MLVDYEWPLLIVAPWWEGAGRALFLGCNEGGSLVIEDSEDKGLWGRVGSNTTARKLVKPAEPPATDLGLQNHTQTHMCPAGLHAGL